MKNIPLKALTLTCLLAGFASVQSHADIIVSEKFDYSLGSDLAGQSGGSGWSNNWAQNLNNGTAIMWNVDLGSTAPQGYSQASSAPGLRLLGTSTSSTNATMDAWRNLSSGISLKPAQQTTVYFSYLWARTDANITNGREWSFLSFRTASGTQLLNFGVSGDELLVVEATADATGGSGTTSATGTETLTVTNDINNTGRYLIVGKMVLNADGTNSGLYLSAYDSTDVLAGEPETWDVSMTTNLIDITIGRIVLTSGQYAGATYWDNITIGTSFADVGGAIPESSTVALVMGAGVLGLVAARRMRRRA